MKELVLKKCLKCGALVEILQDCTCPNCGVKCCGEEMQVVKANSVDAAAEKHVPTFEIKGEEVAVKVNHVMEDEHYIEWIAIANEEGISKKFLKPGDEPTATFKYVPGSTLYAYCNKHSLWETKM